jgi:hypothetical protein
VDLRDCLDAALRILQRLAGGWIGQRGRLEADHRRDELQRVGDAVVHLAEQRLEPGVAGAEIGFGGGFFVFEERTGAHLFERGGEKVEEILADGLHDVIGGASLQCGDGDATFLGTGDVHHRRRIGQAAQSFERFEAVHAGHVMIDRDQVEAFGGRLHDPFGTRFGQRHPVPATLERARGQPPDAGVVVDVEDAGRKGGGKGRRTGHSVLGVRNLDHRQEQPELADRLGETLIIHRLGDVDVAAQIVAALDLDLVVGGGEHDDRRTL